VIVNFWHFLKIAEVAQIFGYFLGGYVILCINVDNTKRIGLYFGHFYPQTHLVTLAPS
jgi:hypothetical protein